jgi:Histidine-specific methyltransferase, SAM-dependent
MTPRTREAKPGGVVDFDQKMELCCRALGVATYREVVFEVFSRAQDRAFARAVALRIHKMRDHHPTNKESRTFWDGLAARLCGDRADGKMLIDASFNQFVQYLPSELQREVSRGSARESLYVPYPSIDLTEPQPIETVVDGLNRGRIDQKHYYLGADSANNWFALVRSEGYPSYDDCKLGLQALVASKQWKQAMTDTQPKSVVMLAGGGAPTKDFLFLRSMLAQPHVRRLDYYLVDISYYMLRESRLYIEQHGKNIDGFEKVKVKAREGDVLKMTARHREEFHEQGKAIFALTAGTIGNLSETAFFTSLNQAAAPGDLLVLTADTIDGAPSDETAKTLTSKYNHDEFRKWIQPVVRAVLNELNSNEPLDDVLDRVNVELRPGDEANSDVPESWSVVLSLEINRKTVTLLTSTRYQAEQLTQFAAAFGWHLLHQVSGPYNSHFKQFLFSRIRGEPSGLKGKIAESALFSRSA